jgi:hypothetical protein
LPKSLGLPGGFNDAKDQDQLQRNLRSALGLDYYVVEPGQKEHPEIPVNSEYKFVGFSPGDEFTVRLKASNARSASRLRLEGGEALVLVPKLGTDRLVHQPFDSRELLRESMREVFSPRGDGSPFNPGKFTVAMLSPTRDTTSGKNDDIVFSLSIQNGNPEAFTPRPAEAWAEIRPIDKQSPTQRYDKYVFYDLDFKAQTSVPVLQFRAPQWPINARDAEVNLFFKIKDTERDLELALDNVLASNKEIERPLGDNQSVRFQVEIGSLQSGTGCRVIVTEIYPQGTELDRFKVDLDPPATTVRRGYSFQGSRVRHVFEYDKPVATVRSYSLRITSRTKLEQDAVKLGAPIEVPIPRAQR